MNHTLLWTRISTLNLPPNRTIFPKTRRRGAAGFGVEARGFKGLMSRALRALGFGLRVYQIESKVWVSERGFGV